MFELRCPVRNCQFPLRNEEHALRCESGHHFDRAKQGYWPLIQPQDRKSVNAGDRDEAVDARQRWLSLGHMEGFVGAVRDWVPSPNPESNRSWRALDLGCGDGSLGAALFRNSAWQYCGADLSKRALRRAARAWPQATWILANADRALPIHAHTVDLLLSFFGRRPATEMARILSTEGQCIVAVPGADDLLELRQQFQREGIQRKRTDAVMQELHAAQLECTAQATWRHRVELDARAIRDALTMTYRGVRRSEQAKIDAMGTMEVTLEADLLQFKRRSASR